MRRIATWTSLLILASVMAYSDQKYTRGVGIYPGNPAEDFAPALVPDQTNYRNLALLRPAYHSSSYDYNLTAQLLTDGIKETILPRWLVSTYSQGGVAKKNEREFLLDHNVTSTVNLGGPKGWVQFELAGGEAPFEIDRIALQASFRAPRAAGGPGAQGSKPPQETTSPGDWSCIVTSSDDGQTWNELGQAADAIPPSPPPSFFGPSGSAVEPSIQLANPSRSRFYRITLKSAAQGAWIVSEVAFFNKNQPVEVGGPYNFNSAWMSEGKGEEWVYVDLGARCTLDRIALYWIRPARAGVVQVSDDAANWKDTAAFHCEGNCGFPETNLRYRGREYDIAVGYHKDMNFTMIRNWVGQTGDEEFYDACDKHGIAIWQDFWLANPVDGPDPSDNDLFLRNAKDFILRIRNHPSLGLYCGRNEGNPPKPIDDGIRKMMPEIHPDLHYISNSAFGVVSGGGPYAAQTPKYYLKNRATTKLHSELGMPNIVSYDSLRQMMPESALWPPALEWGLHDFNLTSAQRLSGFRSMIDKSYGGADNAEDWVTLAQFINYDGYRAIFEAQGKNRMGILLWMSHPCWPSFVWQTYDYYFDPTAGYFGSKKGSEPLHIQWNSNTDMIEIVNYSAGNVPGLTARAEILNMDGSVKWEKTVSLDSAEDSVVAPITMEYPSELSAVHFIRLKLTRGGTTVSENFYWRGTEEGNYQALRTLPKVSLGEATRVERQGSRWILKTELNNASKQPAIMVRLKAVRAKSGDRILPALYSDNYVSLMPGEKRTIQIQLEDADTRGEQPRIVVEGFNVAR